jgi:predicted peroxiredoxin
MLRPAQMLGDAAAIYLASISPSRHHAGRHVHFRRFLGINPPEDVMARRQFFRSLAAIPLFALPGAADESKKKLHIMMKSAWGSDDETRATFVFNHGLALADAGHEVQIFLLGEATVLTRKAVVDAVVPIGWPPLKETFDKLVASKIPVFACGACSRARGVTEADVTQWGFKFGNPTIFVGLVEWADRIITE